MKFSSDISNIHSINENRYGSGHDNCDKDSNGNSGNNADKQRRMTTIMIMIIGKPEQND